MNVFQENPNRVLAVITYQKADKMCKDRIDNWTKHVKPSKVLFSGGDKPFWSPKGSHSIKIGLDRYVTVERDLNLCIRLQETISAAINLADDAENAELILIEPDVWFWGEPKYNNGFTGKNRIDKTWNIEYWHWPYVISGHLNAKKIEYTCKTLIEYKASCHPHGNFPDRFMGLAVNLSGVKKYNGKQLSRNTIRNHHVPEMLNNKEGSYAIHGIKSWDGELSKLK